MVSDCFHYFPAAQPLSATTPRDKTLLLCQRFPAKAGFHWELAHTALYKKPGCRTDGRPLRHPGLLPPRGGAGVGQRGWLPWPLARLGCPGQGWGLAVAHRHRARSGTSRHGALGSTGGIQGERAPRRKREHVLYRKCQESNIWRLRNGRNMTFFMRNSVKQ